MYPTPHSRALLGTAARRAAPLALGMLLLTVAACGNTGGTGGAATPTATTPPAPTATTTSAPTATATPTRYPVKVYFSKHPDSDSNFNAVFPVNRISPTLGVGTFAIKQLIDGPTSAEAATGLFTELTAGLTGTSNCGGPDFTYIINNATHTGTLRFCRPVLLPGDASGPRIKAEITATLTQFPNVTKVIILNYQGHCFDDLRGGDSCLQ